MALTPAYGLGPAWTVPRIGPGPRSLAPQSPVITAALLGAWIGLADLSETKLRKRAKDTYPSWKWASRPAGSGE
jgi:hypothetical protein